MYIRFPLAATWTRCWMPSWAKWKY